MVWLKGIALEKTSSVVNEDVYAIYQIVTELQCHVRRPRAEVTRMLPGGVVQCDTCLSATKAFYYFQTSQSKREAK